MSLSRGQALTEMALVLPVFLLVLFGIIDGARLVYADATLSQAAREGARVGAVEANWVLATPQPTGCVTSEAGLAALPGAHVCPVNVASLKAHIVTAVSRMAPGIAIAASNVYVSCNDGTSTDPTPTGNWTETPGGSSTATPSVGNGCEDATNSAIAHVGWIVSVRIVYSWSPVTPIVSAIWPSFTRTTSASVVVN
jgi:hypothetical protein